MNITEAEWKAILEMYKINGTPNINPINSGLINHTWRVNDSFIVQQINTDVFVHINDLEKNLKLITHHFSNKFPDYFYGEPVTNKEGNLFYKSTDGNYFRVSMYVMDSICHSSALSADLSYEAAKKFGEFSKLLIPLDSHSIKITISDFHNLSLRFLQFCDAVHHGNPERIRHARESIDFLLSKKEIVSRYEYLLKHPDIKLRIAHHDTKISNVLFDKNDKAICVIDWDTVMPGYFWSDVGDMMRTYLSPVNEEEKDLVAIEIRGEYLQAVYQGYMEEMGRQLTTIEKENFLFAGILMTYMQALRFLTDYLNNDIYYGEKYEGHNWVRASNQIELLTQMLRKEKDIRRKLH